MYCKNTCETDMNMASQAGRNKCRTCSVQCKDSSRLLTAQAMADTMAIERAVSTLGLEVHGAS